MAPCTPHSMGPVGCELRGDRLCLITWSPRLTLSVGCTDVCTDVCVSARRQAPATWEVHPHAPLRAPLLPVSPGHTQPPC